MNVKKYFLLFLSFFISIAILSISFGKIQYLEPWPQIFNVGIKNHLMIGKDLVLPNGPLGYLLSKPTLSFPVFMIILFDLFILGVLTLILYQIVTRAKLSTSFRVIFVFVIILMSNASFNLSWFLLWIILFMLFLCDESINYLYLSIAFLITSMIFYIQVDVGMLAFFFIVSFLIHFLAKKVLRWTTALSFLMMYFSLLYLYSTLLSTDIWYYLVNGLSLISGYGDAMHIPLAGNHLVVDFVCAIACLMLLIFYFFLQRKLIASGKTLSFIYFMVFTYFLFLFKWSFVVPQNYFFFDFTILGASLLALFVHEERLKISYYILMPMVLLTCVVKGVEPGFFGRIGDNVSVERIKSRYTLVSEESVTHLALSKWDSTLLKVVSGKSIDIIGTNFPSFYRQILQYCPRPVPLTEFVNTERLNKANAAFLASKGPEFILLNYTPRENQYPLFDEPESGIQLLASYEFNDTAAELDQILFQKRKIENTFYTSWQNEEIIRLNEEVLTEISDDIERISPQIEYTWLGKIFRFFFWAPDVSIALTLTDNSTKIFQYNRFIKSGIIINRFVPPGNNSEYRLFAEHAGRLSWGVKSFRFVTSDGWAFKDEISLKSELIKFDKKENEIAEQFKPMKMDHFISEPDLNVRVNIESFSIDKNRIDMAGWGLVDDSVHGFLRVVPMLESSTHRLIFTQAKNFSRPDVAQVFGRNAPDMSGFYVTIFRDFLKGEIYRGGVVFMDGDKVVKGMALGGAVVDNRASPLAETTSHFFDNSFSFGPQDKEDTLLSNIEVLLIKHHVITIQGWAATRDRRMGRNDAVVVLLKSEDGELFESPTIVDRRPDVSAHFMNTVSDSTGFHATIGTDSIKRGFYELGLYIRDRVKHAGRYQFLQRIAIGFPEQFIVNQYLDTVAEIEMEFNFDKLENFAQSFNVSGWAVDTMRISKKCEIGILLRSEDNRLYLSSTKPVSRPDVTDHFKHKWNLDDSGFEAIISKTGLLRGKYQMGILLHCEGVGPDHVKFTDKVIIK